MSMQIDTVQPRRPEVERRGDGYAAWDIGFYVWEENRDEACAWSAELAAWKPLSGDGRTDPQQESPSAGSHGAPTAGLHGDLEPGC